LVRTWRRPPLMHPRGASAPSFERRPRMGVLEDGGYRRSPFLSYAFDTALEPGRSALLVGA
jgi:hypothetical protein